MRTLIIAAISLACAPVAWAQEVVAPPETPAPTAAAPIDQRAAWCDDYATWLVAMTTVAQDQRAAPDDVRESQHLEVELNSCKIDPQQYERETRAEAHRAVEVAQG
ncbi:MAG: hypothetical protein JNL81_11790 [Hyphomonadaceae bacterium]|nr:hypothetical protein [Hyphomonadaceae bacterium]